MNIRDAKIEIMNALKVYFRKDSEGRYLCPAVRQRPILLMGPPGIGKTAIMEQAAREAGVGLVAYTMTHHTRQSAIGLPHIETRIYQGRETVVTEYTLSEIVASVYDCMERTGVREGILFLDEINCVSETLVPVMLQFLQNKTFGNHRIPDGWLIAAAGNPPEFNPSVREFDIVTLDRVRRIEIQPDLAVWLDYARERQVHGAVISYLSIRDGHFCQVRQTPDGAAFVTPRGWEDLSVLIAGYEALGLPFSQSQAGQFLQDEEIARAFAGYYRLYQKFGEAYGIPEILDGSLEDFSGKIAMAQSGEMDERFSVVNLVLDRLNGLFSQYEQADREVSALHQALGSLKLFLQGKMDFSVFEEFVQGRREALEVKCAAGLLEEEERRLEAWVLRRLEDFSATLRAEFIRDVDQGFERVRELFEEDAARRRKIAENVGAQLNRAFAFLEECFGDGQEMILFVSALARLDRAMDFVAVHGCEPFLKYGKRLIFQEREAELREACREVLGTD